MAQKDASQKILESYNDVFSDIVNVLLFKGRKVLSEEELEDQAPRAYYKADGKIHEIERDVAKRDGRMETYGSPALVSKTRPRVIRICRFAS